MLTAGKTFTWQTALKPETGLPALLEMSQSDGTGRNNDTEPVREPLMLFS